MLYSVVLFAHSYLRWVVLLLAVLVAVRSGAGWKRSRSWDAFDEQAQRAFVWSARLQFLLGLSLYVLLSPITEVFLDDVATALHVRELRFFGLEHALMMLLAVALADIGRARSKRIEEARARHKSVFVFTVIPLALMLAAIPWPFMPTQRQWFRSAPALLATP